MEALTVVKETSNEYTHDLNAYVHFITKSRFCQ